MQADWRSLAEVLKLSTISVAATAPLPLWERVKMPFGIAVPIVAAVLAGLGFGGWLARIRRPWLAGLAAGGLALVATAAIGAGVMALVTMPVPVADPQELAGPTDYGAMILQILWGIGVVVVLPILAAALAGLRAGTLSSRRNRLGWRRRAGYIVDPSRGGSHPRPRERRGELGARLASMRHYGCQISRLGRPQER